MLTPGELPPRGRRHALPLPIALTGSSAGGRACPPPSTAAPDAPAAHRPRMRCWGAAVCPARTGCPGRGHHPAGNGIQLAAMLLLVVCPLPLPSQPCLPQMYVKPHSANTRRSGSWGKQRTGHCHLLQHEEANARRRATCLPSQASMETVKARLLASKEGPLPREGNSVYCSSW